MQIFQIESKRREKRPFLCVFCEISEFRKEILNFPNIYTFSRYLVGFTGHQLPELLELDFSRPVLVDLIDGGLELLVGKIIGDLFQ